MHWFKDLSDAWEKMQAWNEEYRQVRPRLAGRRRCSTGCRPWDREVFSPSTVHGHALNLVGQG